MATPLKASSDKRERQWDAFENRVLLLYTYACSGIPTQATPCATHSDLNMLIATFGPSLCSSRCSSYREAKHYGSDTIQRRLSVQHLSGTCTAYLFPTAQRALWRLPHQGSFLTRTQKSTRTKVLTQLCVSCNTAIRCNLQSDEAILTCGRYF